MNVKSVVVGVVTEVMIGMDCKIVPEHTHCRGMGGAVGNRSTLKLFWLKNGQPKESAIRDFRFKENDNQCVLTRIWHKNWIGMS